MKKMISIAALALIVSFAFAGDRGSNNHQDRYDKHNNGHDNRYHDRDNHDRYTKGPRFETVIYHYPIRPNFRICIPPVVRYQEPVHCGPVPMCPADFCQLKQTIANASFENTKLNIFQQALAYNYFTSQQVLEVMNLFCFESNKLNVAELAYSKTLDQNNYYLVNNGFSFSSSVNELGEYLAMR